MILRHTQSLCPICLRRLDARYEYDTDCADQSKPFSTETVLLKKTCPEHGSFTVAVWTRHKKSTPDFTSWSRPKSPSYPSQAHTQYKLGCPYDCGLCPEHGQHTCTGLVEVTMRCNLHCPVCYAGAGEASKASDPSLSEIAQQLSGLRTQSGRCTVQISGGEPTVRQDLPKIIALAAKEDFGLVQLNTNGLRLAEEEGYAHQLAKAGLQSVYLQFDGTDDATFTTLRGRPLLALKRQAIAACAKAHLGVVLVATVVKGINEQQLGDLLRLALTFGPEVRGLHLQPCAFFGRFPYPLEQAPRLTLPEVLELLSTQAPELVRAEHFHPPACEHELCSFSGIFQRTEHGLLPLQKAATCSCQEKTAPANIASAAEGADQSKRVTQLNWKAWDSENPVQNKSNDRFSAFLAQANARMRFTISCMAFQDALSLDIARVRGCCIHVVQKDGRLVPFCLHNLTSVQGHALYK